MIEGLSIAIAFVFYDLLKVRGHLLWTSFAVLPAVACTYSIFLANWFSNDYFFYDPKTAPKDVEISKVEDVS